MTTIERIEANYTIRDIFGKMEDIETEAQGVRITKKVISKLIAGFFREYWRQGHVSAIRVHLSDGRMIAVTKAVEGYENDLEVIVWETAYSKEAAVLPSKVVSADLRSMVAE